MSASEILVVDDDEGVRYTLRGILEDEGFLVREAPDGTTALELLETDAFLLVLTDLRMPGMDGLELLRRARLLSPTTPVVLMTAHGSERHAVEAMRRGAWDYFRKPFDNDELLAVVRRAVAASGLTRENERLEGEVNLLRSLVFASASMSRLATLVRRVAPLDVTVLITGESGTGKERVAEALVQASPRANKPFVKFNCASLSPQLAEAELFGHAKGAFTGAVRTRAGLFREADGGTLLLDEIGELDQGVQAKLLRVLQEREVRPVGEDRAVAVDVRILAATHRSLAKEVEAGRFREDLFYRLNVVNLQVPPLRDRPDDIPVLARRFLAQACERFGVRRIAPSAELLDRLVAYDWPGNVRELENALESLVALSAEGEPDLSLLPSSSADGAFEPPPGAGLKERVDAYERAQIVMALAASHGQRTEAARRLGLGRATLHDKLKKYGLLDAD